MSSVKEQETGASSPASLSSASVQDEDSTIPNNVAQPSKEMAVDDDDEATLPKDILNRMAHKDALQNRRLSASVNGLVTANSADVLYGGRHQNKFTQMRFAVCILGLLSLATSQMSRIVFNFTITQMVDQNVSEQNKHEHSIDGSCPWPNERNQSSQSREDSLFFKSDNYGDTIVILRDVDETDIDFALGFDTITTNKSIDNVDRFKWTVQNQQVLMGGFYYSYFLFMILGGRMAEIYGAKYVLLLSVAGSALINLATPWMARNSFALLLISRIIMGAIQSGVFPGMYALINKWLTLNEASLFTPLIKLNLRLGSVLASSMAGIINGWPNVFYWTGCLCAAWSLFWFFVATSDPVQNRYVSPEELAHINRKKQRSVKDIEANTIELKKLDTEKSDESQVNKPKNHDTPWLMIITSPSVIALILVKLTFNYAIDFLSILLPSYLDYVHHLNKEQRSWITTPMFFIQVLLIFFIGWLAKIIVQKRPLGMSKTTIRKMFQGIASYGLAITFLLFTFNNCNFWFLFIILQLASLLSMFTAGGETMLPYDLSSKYPATIMAIANSVANISAVTTTTLASFILGDQGGNYARWNKLVYLIAGANIFGASAFTLLVKAEPIDFSEHQKQSDVQSSDGDNEKIDSSKQSIDKQMSIDLDTKTENQN